MKQENATEKKDLLVIKNEPIEFPSAANTMITTTKELALAINQIFKPIFKDFYGSFVDVEFDKTRGYIQNPTITFKVLPNDQYNDTEYFAAKPLSAIKGGMDVIERRNHMISNRKSYIELTPDFKNAISKFMINSEKIKWDTFRWEDTYDVKATNDGTTFTIRGLDIIKLLKAIYGAYDVVIENGQEKKIRIEYTSVVTRPIGIMQYKAPDTWGVNVMRLSEDELVKAFEKLGFGTPMLGAEQVIRA